MNLFVYGTLREPSIRAKVSPALSATQAAGLGTVRGTLYDAGAYPAAIVDETCEFNIHGEVIVVPDHPGIWSALDEYEDYDPTADPAQNLFVRKIVDVTKENGTRERCFIYAYNRPIIGLTPITASWTDTKSC